MSASQKIGYLPLVAIVIGSQVGSGVFMLPQVLAPFGFYALCGWLASGVGALTLALVFVGLVRRLPHTGGPHVYVQAALGPIAGYFTGWTYWLVSSLSCATVIASTINYLTPIIGVQGPAQFAACELALLALVCVINLRGVASASLVEAILAVIKVITLILIPLAGLYYYNSANIQTDAVLQDSSAIVLTGKAAVLTMWAFLGVEAATAPAGSVKNPSFTVPAALLSGTLFVIFLYLLNSISLLGLIEPSALAATTTPYVLATQYIFGGNWHLVIAGFAALVCVSNLNAWILTSGQIAYGLACENLLPRIFKQRNEHQAPIWAIITSCAVIVPLILLTMDDNASNQISLVIGFSVQSSLFIYFLCSISYWIILQREGKPWWQYEKIIAILSGLFCISMVCAAQWHEIVFSTLFVFAGLPMYWLHVRPVLAQKKLS